MEIRRASVSLLWFLWPSLLYQRHPAEALTRSSRFHVLLLIKVMLSSLACLLVFCINYLLLLEWGIIVSQRELALKCRFCKYRIFFHSLKDNNWQSKSIDRLNYLFVLGFISKFLRKMCLSKPGNFFCGFVFLGFFSQMKHCLNSGFKSQMC